MLQECSIEQAGELTLAEKIDLFEKHLGIYLTIHDVRGLLSLEFRDYLLPGRRWHRCPYCWEGRFSDDSWSMNCTGDCMHRPHQRCRQDSSPYWKMCWKGIWELVVPISRNGQNMLILFAGVFRDGNENVPEIVRSLPDFHRELYSKLPLKSSVDTLQLTAALEFFGNALLAELERATSNQPVVSGNMRELIRSFIAQNAVHNITLGDLAGYLYLSKSRTGHAVKQYLGKSFSELLREERMTRAVNLLATNPHISIAELAASTGYQDPAYFMRVFSKTYGMGPRSFQKKSQKR